MPPAPSDIRAPVQAYLLRHPAEHTVVDALLAVLDTAGDPTCRTTRPAHITCSAVVVNRDQQVLHIPIGRAVWSSSQVAMWS